MKWDKLATLIYFLHPLVIKIVTQLFKIIEIKISSVITYIIVVFFTLMISFMLLKFYNKRKEEKMKVTNLESRNISEESEFTMPPIGLGTYPMRGKELIKTVIHSKKEGYQLYDTSSAYGNEKWLGLALKLSLRKREDYFIITKVSNTEQREGNIKKAFERQLERLGVDYIDLYLMHWPQTDTFVETWKQMEEIYREGKVKMIGVSNFHEHHLEKLLKNATVAPAFNEIELHPLLSQEPLVKYCQSKGIRIISYSPFARMDKKLIEHPVLVEIANKYSKKVTQIILKWNVQLGYIPIPKTSNKQRLKENIDIFDFELTQDDMKKINSINENYRVRYDPDNCDFSKL